MNALQMAKTAYAANQTPIRTPRGTEYEAFARVTHRLKSAANEETPFPELAAALHANRQLWTLLAADVAEPDNALPANLRARVFYLAEFTAHQTSRILRGVETVDVLVDINTAVMRGLRHAPEAT